MAKRKKRGDTEGEGQPGGRKLPKTGGADLRTAGQKHREQAAARSRARTAATADIGQIPPVRNPQRKRRCRRDLLKFVTTYFPQSTGLSPFGPDQKRMVARIQNAVFDGGRFINCFPRGSAKTTIVENSALWATLYGHRLYVAIYAADAKLAEGSLDSLKMELAENDLLYEDFPEVCHAVRDLEWKPQRAAGQTYGGQFTHIDWTADTVVLPTIPRSPASGVILTTKGITGASRGRRHKRPDGSAIRPDFVLIDDPQTDESARSQEQTRTLMRIIKKGIGRSGSHTSRLAIVINATVICPGDLVEQLADAKRNPSWQCERVKMVRRWADHHEDKWLGEYARLRNTFNRDDPADQRRAHAEANAYYADNQAVMDRGCEVYWEHCYSREAGEISAIQHAYNILIDEGEEVFASECQNQPLAMREQLSPLTAAAIAAKVNGIERGLVPRDWQHVVSYIDVHARVLYWIVAGFGKGFAGSVIDYGTYPEQPLPYFSQDNAPRAMADVHRGMVEDAWLLAGLGALVDRLLARQYMREDGAAMKITRQLVDIKWGEKNKLLKQFCRRHAQAFRTLWPAQGLGLGAAEKPFDQYRDEAGAKVGQNWRIPPPKNGDRWVTIDTNWWKSFAATRLAAPMGTPGGFELFGRDPRVHELLADHCTSEEPIQVSARKGQSTRTVEQWKMKEPRSDNHWWDCLVGCFVAASMDGLAVPGIEKPKRGKLRVSYL